MFTIKKILRALSIFCTFFVFMPSFLVSCSGQDVEVNVMTAVSGVEMYGEKVVDPHPLMLLCLFIPIAVFAITFVKKLVDKSKAALIAALTVVDTILWIVFKSTTKSLADQNYCSFKTTAWYWINFIFLIFIIVLSVLVIIDKFKIDSDLSKSLSNNDTKKVLGQLSDKISEVSNKVTTIAGETISDISKSIKKEDIIGYCVKCGSALTYDSKFCTKCGEPLPDSLKEKAELRKKQIEEDNKIKEKENIVKNTKVCKNCGAILDDDSEFCTECGTKVEK